MKSPRLIRLEIEAHEIRQAARVAEMQRLDKCRLNVHAKWLAVEREILNLQHQLDQVPAIFDDADNRPLTPQERQLLVNAGLAASLDLAPTHWLELTDRQRDHLKPV